MSGRYNNPWEFTNFNKDQIGDDLLGRRVNGFEAILIAIGIVVIIGVGAWAFIGQERINRDQQRASDIAQVVRALNNFYKNSSATEIKRFYPIFKCFSDPNEVDFENTLRLNLTGQNLEADDFVYIQPRVFPVDRSGTYSDILNERSVPYRCPEKLSPIKGQPDRIYSDSKSCNFKQGSSYVQCYLYSSSATGDAFKVAYRSEVDGCFRIYSAFRGGAVSIAKQC